MRPKPANQALAIALALLTSLSLAGCGIGKISISSSCLGPCTVPPTPEFLYAATTDHILVFTVDQSTGALGAPLTRSTSPAECLRRFPALPFPLAILPYKRRKTSLASSCT